MRVLIVEDSPDRIAILKRVFAAHEVVVAQSAMVAGQQLLEDRFALVLLDFDLADDQTGEVVAQMIADQGPPYPDVVVHSLNPDGVRCIRTLLPGAIELPITSLDRANPVYGRLMSELATGRRVNWGFVLIEKK